MLDIGTDPASNELSLDQPYLGPAFRDHSQCNVFLPEENRSELPVANLLHNVINLEDNALQGSTRPCVSGVQVHARPTRLLNMHLPGQ